MVIGNLWSERKPEELELAQKVEKYLELYFEDMTFRSDSILHDFLCYEYQDDSGQWIEGSQDLNPLGLDDFSFLTTYRFEIADLEGCGGVCNCKEHLITIDPEYREDATVILHELIHALEGQLLEKNYSSIHQSLRDMLTFALYRKLKPEIGDLDERIVNHAHELQQEDIIIAGGYHGILFFLKSLDLDLRLGWKLGTVCGYGRDSY